MTKTLKNVTALSLATVLFVLSPGLPAYQVFAQVVARSVPTGMNLPVTVGVNAAVLPGASSALSHTGALQNTAVPALKALPGVRVQAAAASPAAQAAQAVQAAAKAAPVAAPAAAAAVQPAAPRQAASKEISRISGAVGQTLEKAGSLSSSSAETARGTGAKVQALLTGARFNAAEDAPLSPAVEIGGVSHGFQLARPAGQELADSVRAFQTQAAVPAPVDETQPQQPPTRQSPTWPKFLAAGLALLPAALLGWPLLALGGSLGLALGGATIASSVLLAMLPFMGANTPKAVRIIPGLALAALGLTAAFGAFTLGTGYAAAALVALGGWGLIRYGKSEDARRGYDNEYALSAFFGALGATALPVLALMPAAGILATALLVGAYISSALLLMHLPSWIGFGITTIVWGLYYGTRGIHRVEGSMRRDTVLYDRLTRFTKDQLDRSPWNMVWLAGIWIPVWISEAVQWALSIAVGLTVGAMQSPVLFLWGSINQISEKSRANIFFAEWAHSMFDNVQGGKKAIYNPLIQRLLPFVNSKNKLVSMPASLGLRLMQWGWLLYALVGTPVLGLVGFVRAFGRSATPYDYARHSPRSLRVSTDDKAGENTEEPNPTDPAKPGKSTLVPRLIATTFALLPAGFFGVPMLLTLSPVFGGLFLALTLSLAALPFLPASTPKRVRQLPGVLLSGMGAFMLGGLYLFFIAEPVAAMGVHTLLALAGLAGTNGFWMGSLGLVGGWGFSRYLGQATEGGKNISPDDPEYIGAFFGATAAAAGLGALIMGLSGWPLIVLSGLAYLTSPLLLMHLPRWVWSGFGEAIEGVVESARGFYRVLNVWERETGFHRNIRKHANYWLDKTVWNGAWLSVIWVPMWLTQLAELALAGVLGLTVGLVRAPFNYAAGAFSKAMPGSKLDRFFGTFVETWLEQSEGTASYEQFKRSNRRSLEWMNASKQPSGRPTIGAVLSGLAVRMDQAVWLIGTMLATPVLMAYAAYEGLKAAASGAVDLSALGMSEGAQPSAASAQEQVLGFLAEAVPTLPGGANWRAVRQDGRDAWIFVQHNGDEAFGGSWTSIGVEYSDQDASRFWMDARSTILKGVRRKGNDVVIDVSSKSWAAMVRSWFNLGGRSMLDRRQRLTVTLSPETGRAVAVKVETWNHMGWLKNAHAAAFAKSGDGNGTPVEETSATQAAVPAGTVGRTKQEGGVLLGIPAGILMGWVFFKIGSILSGPLGILMGLTFGALFFAFVGEASPDIVFSETLAARDDGKEAGRVSMRFLSLLGSLGALGAGVFLLVAGTSVGLGAALMVAGGVGATLALTLGHSSSDGEGSIVVVLLGFTAAVLGIGAAVVAVPLHALLGLSWAAADAIAVAAVAIAAGVYFYIRNRNSGPRHGDSRMMASDLSAPVKAEQPSASVIGKQAGRVSLGVLAALFIGSALIAPVFLGATATFGVLALGAGAVLVKLGLGFSIGRGDLAGPMAMFVSLLLVGGLTAAVGVFVGPWVVAGLGQLLSFLIPSAHAAAGATTVSAAGAALSVGAVLLKAGLGLAAGLGLTGLLYKLGVLKQSGGDISGPAGVFFNYAAMAVLGAALAVFAVPLWNLLAAATIPGVLWTVGRTVLGGVIGLAAGVALDRSGAIDQKGGDITGPATEFAIVASIGVLGALLGAFAPLLLGKAAAFLIPSAHAAAAAEAFAPSAALAGLSGSSAMSIGVGLLAAVKAFFSSKAGAAVLGALVGLGLTALMHRTGAFNDGLLKPDRLELAMAYIVASGASALLAVALLMAL